MPLDPAALRALAAANYTIIDQAVRTPGLLIVQAPDEQRPPGGGSSVGQEAEGDGAAASVCDTGDGTAPRAPRVQGPVAAPGGEDVP